MCCITRIDDDACVDAELYGCETGSDVCIEGVDVGGGGGDLTRPDDAEIV